jgi:hypothetical protein
MTTDSAYQAPELTEIGSIINVTQANWMALAQDGYFSLGTPSGGNNPGHHGS